MKKNKPNSTEENNTYQKIVNKLNPEVFYEAAIGISDYESEHVLRMLHNIMYENQVTTLLECEFYGKFFDSYNENSKHISELHRSQEILNALLAYELAKEHPYFNFICECKNCEENK